MIDENIDPTRSSSHHVRIIPKAMSEKLTAITLHYGSIDSGYRQLCTQCFNAEVAELHGLDDFENIRIEPIGLTGCAGEEHPFQFQTRLRGALSLWKPLSFEKGIQLVISSS